HGSGRAFDRKIGMGGKRFGLDQGTRDTLGIEPSSRLGMVTRSRAGEREVRHAGGEPAREHAADSAEAGNRDAGYRHKPTVDSARAPGSWPFTRRARRSQASATAASSRGLTTIFRKDKPCAQ